MQERVNAISTELLFFALEINRIEDADARREAEGAGARALRAVAARRRAPSGRISSPTRSRSCCTRNRSPARSAWTRLFDETDGGAALSDRRQGADQRRGAASPVRARSGDCARAAAKSLGKVFGDNARALRAHHQHARQGQGDRGSLAQLQAPDLVAQPRQLRRGRGGGRADRGGARSPIRASRIAITS